MRRSKDAEGRQRHDLRAAREIGDESVRPMACDDLAAGLARGVRHIGIDVEGSVQGNLLGVQDIGQMLATAVFFPRRETDDLLRTVLQDGQEILHGLAADEADHHGPVVVRHTASPQNGS